MTGTTWSGIVHVAHARTRRRPGVGSGGEGECRGGGGRSRPYPHACRNLTCDVATEHGLERLVGLVAHHTGARFEAEAHGLADRITTFQDEASAVSTALAYNGLTTGPAGECVTPAERLAEIERRYGRTSLVVRALANASDTLAAMVGRTEQRLAECHEALGAMAST
jgi:hypothetical protein